MANQKNGLWSESRSSRKWTQIENRTDGAPSFFTGYTLKVLICRILASAPFPLQSYYSRGRNVKFYSTSHVNTFLMMTNDRGELWHTEKSPQSSKKRFFSFFHFFHFLITFFEKVRPPSFGIWPSVKFIGWQTKKRSLKWITLFPQIKSDRKLNGWSTFIF